MKKCKAITFAEGNKVIFDSPTYRGRQIEGEFVKDLGNGQSLVRTFMAGFAPYHYKIDNSKIYSSNKAEQGE